MKLIDTHAHIYLKDFDDDIESTIERSLSEGVEMIFMPNIDSKTHKSMIDLENRFPEQCKSMIGLHPCSVKESFEEELEWVENELKKGDYIAVGEIGTDLYWDDTYWEQQKIAFIRQLTLASDYELPVAIHCRETIDETIEIIKGFKGDLTGVFHCFTGTAEQARRITGMGFYLGIGGVSTFKNSGMKEILHELDIDKVVLETDSPYLAPVPFRGKRNEPGYLMNIALQFASARELTIGEVAEITTRNALKLFSKV